VVICLERGADLHIAQLMPLPHTVSCFSKIQIGFTFLVPAHSDSPGQRAVKRTHVHCTYALTDGRTARKHNVSGPIYWSDGGIKIILLTFQIKSTVNLRWQCTPRGISRCICLALRGRPVQRCIRPFRPYKSRRERCVRRPT